MSTWCKESDLELSHSNWMVDSASKRNEYQEYLLVGKGCRNVGPTNLPPSWADFLEILEPQHPGTLREYPGLYGAGLPYHSNGAIVDVLIVKFGQKIYRHIFKRIPIQAWKWPLVSHRNHSYVATYVGQNAMSGMEGHVTSADIVGFCSLCYDSLIVEWFRTEQLGRKKVKP
jgi:hypothetical protein